MNKYMYAYYFILRIKFDYLRNLRRKFEKDNCFEKGIKCMKIRKNYMLKINLFNLFMKHFTYVYFTTIYNNDLCIKI